MNFKKSPLKISRVHNSLTNVMPRTGPAARRWCFTLPNYTPEDEQLLQSLQTKYLIYGREISPSTNTPHLQGYIEFTNAKTLAATKAYIGLQRLHLEIANGTGAQNKTYCSKSDSDPYESGQISAQGARTDIAGYVAAIREGATTSDLMDSHPVELCKYHGFYDRIRHELIPERHWQTEIFWFYGPTGTGKSHTAHQEAGPDVYRKPPGKWWDGYEGQQHVIFDEFRPDWLKFYELLLICDKYPLRVEIKGGWRNFAAKKLWITAPIKWDEMFRSQTEEKLNQLQRRITETRFFPFRYTGPDIGDEIAALWDNNDGIPEVVAPDLNLNFELFNEIDYN